MNDKKVDVIGCNVLMIWKCLELCAKVGDEVMRFDDGVGILFSREFAGFTSLVFKAIRGRVSTAE